MATVVEVKPLPKKRWHGKDGKESFTRPKTIEVLYDTETGGYNTGLTEEEATKYGKMMGVDLGNVYVEGIPHTYWSTKPAQIPLQDHTMLFYPDRAVDFVKIKNMKASKFVANSYKEFEEGKWPFATHYIHDENDEIEAKASKVALKNKAIKRSLEMSLDGKIMMVMIIRNKNLKGRSSDLVDVEIDSIIEDDAKTFLQYANMDREEVTIRAQIYEMLDKNILYKDGTSIMYMGDSIGYDFDAAVDYLKKPENQTQKLRMVEKLNK